MRIDCGLQIIRRSCHCSRQDRQRIAIAACRDRVDGGLLVRSAGIGLEQDNGARGLHHRLDLGILLLRKR